MPAKYLNLRSDTVTLPTKEMYEAIMEAKLGDDNRGEDKTVNKLEEMAAAMFDKEAGILMSSGTMGNLIGAMVQTGHGDEIIMEKDAHMFQDEQGAFAAIGGLVANLVKGNNGYTEPDDIERAIRPLNNIHKPRTSLVCLENTHNHAGGTVITPQQIDAVAELSHSYNIPVHLDGARIFNAAVKLGVDVKCFVKKIDTITFCLSKGLSCPAGALLLGRKEIIEKARKLRKRLGGTMRQAGIIAAPGIVALNSMINRLSEDHDNLKILAEGLRVIPGLRINMEAVQTNMVYVDINELSIDSDQFVTFLKQQGVEALVSTPCKLRFVTHRHIKRKDILRVLEVVEKVAKTAKR